MQEEKVNEIENTEPNRESSLEDLLKSREFQEMYAKMHTPWVRRIAKIGRNEICPFCNSGKKYKNCQCYKNAKDIPLYTINY